MFYRFIYYFDSSYDYHLSDNVAKITINFVRCPKKMLLFWDSDKNEFVCKYCNSNLQSKLFDTK